MPPKRKPKTKSDQGILTSLLSFFGVSGNESSVREFIRSQISPYVDEVRVDRMGNLVARKKGRHPSVMLAAHMDEIGLMVKRIDQKGFIYCAQIGGIDPVSFLGSQVHVQGKSRKIHGFLTTLEMSSSRYISTLPRLEDMFVDTGLGKKELERLGVEIGNSIYLESHTCCEGGGLVLGKALDNRIGCYILIELAKKLKTSAEVYFVFTVQEEVGLYGAKTSAFQISPDWGVAVDTTHANDAYPEPSRAIGMGPCIKVKDGEYISNPCIVRWLKAIARKNKIPFQMEAIEEGTTDAAIMQTTKTGIPTAVLSVPVRNIHTTAGIAKMSDIENAIRLLQALLKSPPKVCLV